MDSISNTLNAGSVSTSACTGGGNTTSGYYSVQPQPCPTCGRCPTCGKGGYQTYPYPYYHYYYPYGPYWSGAGWTGGWTTYTTTSSGVPLGASQTSNYTP